MFICTVVLTVIHRMVKLVKNFRSHETILRFPNERFYSGDLRSCGDPKSINSFLKSPVLASPKFPIVFHAITGKDDREASSPSFFNIDEVTLVKDYVQQLRADRKFRVCESLIDCHNTLVTDASYSGR